jgi:hypothetical protein
MVRRQEDAVIRVTFVSGEAAPLNLISRTLVDLNALYELIVSLSDPKYARQVKGTKEWRVRRRSRLDKSDQPAVRTIQLSSPLVIEISVAAAASLWALVQALEKVANWSSERRMRKIREQREAIGLERDRIALGRDWAGELERLIAERHAEKVFNQAAHRLAEDLPIASVTPRSLPPQSTRSSHSGDRSELRSEG